MNLITIPAGTPITPEAAAARAAMEQDLADAARALLADGPAMAEALRTATLRALTPPVAERGYRPTLASLAAAIETDRVRTALLLSVVLESAALSLEYIMTAAQLQDAAAPVSPP